MTDLGNLGYCLASQQIREKITQGKIIPNTTNFLLSTEDTENVKKNWFLDESLESRIQPSSYEPTIGDHLFVLDADMGGVLRPELEESVKKTLLLLPKRQRQKASIEGGYELKRGFSYLIPLEDRISLENDEQLISSPKSSRGRIFVITRLLVDYNPCFNEADGYYKPNENLNLWLLVQPRKFNLVLYPHTTLNQLRFFKGKNSQLTDSEIMDETSRKPIFYHKSPSGELIPQKHIIRDGLQVHLDVLGEHTEGIVGLRARDNPNPIDLQEKYTYESEAYFEPIKAKDNKTILSTGECCLFSSQEVLKMPNHLSSELEKHSHI